MLPKNFGAVLKRSRGKSVFPFDVLREEMFYPNFPIKQKSVAFTAV